MVVRGTRDDEGRARLVDQDRIDLIDDREVEAALYPIAVLERHVVAQVVEAELVVGPVGDVRGVGRLPFRLVEPGDDDAGAHPEALVDLAHPLGVAARQVIVDRDDVDPESGQGIQIGGERRDQRLALAGPHLRDLARVQHHPADELHVEMTHIEGALADLAHHGEGLGQELVERLASGITIAKLSGLGRDLFVRELRTLGLEGVDLLDGLGHALEQPIVAAAEDAAQESGDVDRRHVGRRRDEADGGAQYTTVSMARFVMSEGHRSAAARIGIGQCDREIVRPRPVTTAAVFPELLGLRRLDAVIQAAMPDELRAHWQIGRLTAGTLTLFAGSPVWAARLRYFAPH